MRAQTTDLQIAAVRVLVEAPLAIQVLSLGYEEALQLLTLAAGHD